MICQEKQSVDALEVKYQVEGQHSWALEEQAVTLEPQNLNAPSSIAAKWC